jgi:hypothetical protein
MKSPNDPITPDEWLLRRVHLSSFKLPLGSGLQYGSFVPRGKKSRCPDDTGISLYRAVCLPAAESVLAGIEDEVKRRQNGVVRVMVSEISALGLEVVIEHDAPDDPAAGIPGHVVIPQLTGAAWEDPEKKRRLKVVIERLAEIAGRPENVLVMPSAE